MKYRDDLAKWRSDVAVASTKWAKDWVKRLNDPVLRRTTEGGSGTKWLLGPALRKAGTIFATEPNPTQCLVMLGGLAVLDPPSGVSITSLKNTTLIAAGWNGTDKVQRKWKAALAKVGSKIIFLPVEVTRLSLTEYVSRCLGTPGPSPN